MFDAHMGKAMKAMWQVADKSTCHSQMTKLLSGTPKQYPYVGKPRNLVQSNDSAPTRPQTDATDPSVLMQPSLSCHTYLMYPPHIIFSPTLAPAPEASVLRKTELQKEKKMYLVMQIDENKFDAQNKTAQSRIKSWFSLKAA